MPIGSAGTRQDGLPHSTLAAAEVEFNGTPEPYEVVVFDGKGHAGTMVFTTDSRGRRIQRLRHSKAFKAHFSHVVK